MSSTRTPRHVVEPEKRIPVIHEVDVAVAGAGISGLFAAIAAGRLGARTVLIDRLGTLGGNMGPGLILAGSIAGEADGTLPGGLWGIPKEFVKRLEELQVSPEKNYIDQASIVSYLGFKMCDEAGVELLLSTYASDPIVEDGTITGLFVEGRSGRTAITSRVVVDGTGRAAIAARAGASIIDDIPPGTPCTSLVRSSSGNSGGIRYAVGAVDMERYQEFLGRKTELTDEDKAWREEQMRSLPDVLVPAARKAYSVARSRRTGGFDR